MYRRFVTSLGSADYLLVASEGPENMADRPGVERLIDNLSVKFWRALNTRAADATRACMCVCVCATYIIESLVPQARKSVGPNLYFQVFDG